MFKKLRYDINAIKDRDPAARSKAEIFFLYPGLHALWWHRVAHFFYRHKMFFLARWISQGCRFYTGIEIHPGATIGKGLFIDHGLGTVIGETTVIGDNCTINQGVTLGGTGKETGKRHPTLGDNVLVGTGAIILGSFHVGDNAKVGAGSTVLDEVEPGETVAGTKARVVRRGNDKVSPCDDMDSVHIPDPIAQEICRLLIRIEQLEHKIEQLEKKNEDI
jgi:serine O-acetyltransferase